jgi:hypothetical protein
MLVEAQVLAEELAWKELLSFKESNSNLNSPYSAHTNATLSVETTPSSPSSSDRKQGSSSPSRRSLHDKLSSPDRKKNASLSSEQVLTLYQAKQSLAELNREQTIEEKR